MSYMKDSNVDFVIDKDSLSNTSNLNLRPMIGYLILLFVIFVGMSIIIWQARQINHLSEQNAALQATVEAAIGD